MLRIPRPIIQQSFLVALGSGLVTYAAFLPMPWAGIAFTVGGLLGGKALLQRPGDVRVPR